MLLLPVLAVTTAALPDERPEELVVPPLLLLSLPEPDEVLFSPLLQFLRFMVF